MSASGLSSSPPRKDRTENDPSGRGLRVCRRVEASSLLWRMRRGHVDAVRLVER